MVNNIRNNQPRQWWHDAIFYEIYSQSFKDSNADGFGDIPGIIEKLDYLTDLGVDCLWLTPIHQSPFMDSGYDTSNYIEIDPAFGTLIDFQKLVFEAHRRNLKVILDLVIGYTADSHPWFTEGRKSKNAPTHDYYVWGGNAAKGLLNNWFSAYAAQPAWNYNPATDEYYFYAFLPSQPHLNLANLKVQDELLAVTKYWLDQGIDGFRVDAINWTIADQERRDNPGEGFKQVHIFDRNQQGVHGLLKRLRRLADSYARPIVLIGEVAPGHSMECKEYYGLNHDELHLNFNLYTCEVIRPKGWYTGNFLPGAKQRLAEQVEGFTLKDLREAVQDHDLSFRAIDLWPTVVVGNHDRPRVYSLYGRLVQPEHRDQMAKLVAAFTILSKGTPFIYYGEEIGMENMVFESVTEFKDNFGVCLYENLVNEGKLSPEDALVYAHLVTRDVSRTPMQWDGTLQAGFSSNSKTWLRVNPDYVTKNVRAQQAEPNSIYNFYKRLIELRKKQPAFCEGEYVWVDKSSNDYLAFLRRGKEDAFLVALNFSEQALEIPLNFEEYGIKSNGVKILLSSHSRSLIENHPKLSLQPVETLIGKLI